MPPFKTVAPLGEICSDWVWKWLFHCLNQEASPQSRMLQREYIIATLNPNIRQHLLNRVCKAHMYKVECSSKCFLIELLGDKSTQCVDLSQSGHYYIDGVYQLYRTLTFSLILNLTKLGIICNVKMLADRKHLPDLNVTFYRVFNQMKNLRWLTLGGMADETMMGILGNNCYQLEYLDITNSSYVNDEGIARLVLKDPAVLCGRSKEQLSRLKLPTTECCSKLYFVCTSGTSITMKGVMILVKCLPKLKSLGSQIDRGSVCSLIELLQPKDEIKVFQFNELNDSVITDERASLLSLACPHLTKLTTCMTSMHILHMLNPLQSLTVEDMRQDPWYIYNYLQMRGDTLKELILKDNITNPLDLSWIMELTPNLEVLEGNIIIDEKYEVPTWEKLKVARVSIRSSNILLVLSTKTPMLKELNICFSPEPYSETFHCLNDDLLIYIALSGGLKKLEKLIIRECALTVRCIDCLLIHCAELWYIGYLTFWENILEEDVKRLKIEAIENNWNLRLVMQDDWED